MLLYCLIEHTLLTLRGSFCLVRGFAARVASVPIVRRTLSVCEDRVTKTILSTVQYVYDLGNAMTDVSYMYAYRCCCFKLLSFEKCHSCLIRLE